MMPTARVRRSLCLIVATSVLLVSGCKGGDDHAIPPRANDAITVPPQASLITVPINADLGNLLTLLEKEVPRTLWSINQPNQSCVPSKSVDIGIAKIKTPNITCRIVGQVTRGPLRFAGQGQEILLAIPIQATVSAEDIGGVLKRETATASALVRAAIKISLAEDWTPRGTVNIRYDWAEEPHIQFLGQKIRFTEQTDQKLAPVIAQLERELPGQLGKLHVRQQVEQAWRAAFTSLEINAQRPPVWMRITPEELQYGGYHIDGQRLQLNLGVKAVTETFVGDRPQNPTPTALPPLRPLAEKAGQLAFFSPVFADYKELEPVLMKALVKRSSRPFDVPGIGPVDTKFHKATIYGTTNNRIAVGVTFTARDQANRASKTDGTVWITAKPMNETNSRKITFADIEISGTTDMTGGDLILQLANAPGLRDTIAYALAQNFENDYNTLLNKIDHAIEAKQAGGLIINAQITGTRTGEIKAAGQGLYLPVWADGNASIHVQKSQ